MRGMSNNKTKCEVVNNGIFEQKHSNLLTNGNYRHNKMNNTLIELRKHTGNQSKHHPKSKQLAEKQKISKLLFPLFPCPNPIPIASLYNKELNASLSLSRSFNFSKPATKWTHPNL